MKIIPIFTSETSHATIYSAPFDHQELCEFDRIFEEWNNPAFLDTFFSSNTHDLQYGYYSISEAIYRTLEEAAELEEILLECDANGTTFENIFKPLGNDEYHTKHDGPSS